MRKLILIIIVALIAVSASATAPKFARDSVEIIPIHIGGGGIGGGRSEPSAVFCVSLMKSFNAAYIIITVYQNLGEVYYEIANQSSGVCCFDSFTALQGSYPIPVPANPGHYHVTFVLPDGRTYEGEYYI